MADPHASRIFPGRGQSVEKGPGTHVLLMGVSHYPYARGGEREKPKTYGIAQLSAPARTAHDIATWLVSRKDKLARPLRTLRILASPSAAERGAHGALGGFPPATLDNVKEAVDGWHKDANDDGDNIAIFYFAGHGIRQTAGFTVLLLEDFLRGSRILECAIDFTNLYNGMRSCAAATQCYFIDACRVDVAEFHDFERLPTTELFDTAYDHDNRVATIFFAAADGHETYAEPNGQTLFGKDVLQCLMGAAGERVLIQGQKKWVIRVGKLGTALGKLVGDWNASAGNRVRTYNCDKYTDLDPIIHVLDDAPDVKCTFTVTPPEGAQRVTIELSRVNSNAPSSVLRPPLKPDPYPISAGIYSIRGSLPSVNSSSAPNTIIDTISVDPPLFNYPLLF